MFLEAMVQHGRVELLAHPLSQKYLQMKWNSYGKYFHMFHLLFYLIFLVFVTMYSSHILSVAHCFPENTTTNENTVSISILPFCIFVVIQMIIFLLICFLNFVTFPFRQFYLHQI